MDVYIYIYIGMFLSLFTSADLWIRIKRKLFLQFLVFLNGVIRSWGWKVAQSFVIEIMYCNHSCDWPYFMVYHGHATGESGQTWLSCNSNRTSNRLRLVMMDINGRKNEKMTTSTELPQNLWFLTRPSFEDFAASTYLHTYSNMHSFWIIYSWQDA